MGIFEIGVLVAAGLLALPMLKKKEDKPVDNPVNVNPAPVTPVPEPPTPVPAPEPPAPEPAPDTGELTIVDIVTGWHCFRSQCGKAGLNKVMGMLDEIFPVLNAEMSDGKTDGDVDNE